jgi:predicted metal-binding protein
MDKQITAVPAPWQGMVLSCAKCSRKLDGGFGKKGRQALPKMLKEALRASGRRQAFRVVETPCLGLCPRKAVAVIRGDRPAEMLVVPEGLPATEVLERLLR